MDLYHHSPTQLHGLDRGNFTFSYNNKHGACGSSISNRTKQIYWNKESVNRHITPSGKQDVTRHLILGREFMTTSYIHLNCEAAAQQRHNKMYLTNGHLKYSFEDHVYLL